MGGESRRAAGAGSNGACPERRIANGGRSASVSRQRGHERRRYGKGRIQPKIFGAPAPRV